MRTIVLGMILLTLLLTTDHAVAQAPTCNSSGSGGYMVDLCLDSPANGSTISGATPVIPSILIAGPSPGIQRVTYYLDGANLLTAFAAPYSFLLPSALYVDGNHTLAVEVLLRDGYVTPQTLLTINFNNGNSTPPINTNSFSIHTPATPPAGHSLIVAATGDGAGGRPESALVTDLIVAAQPALFLYLGDVYDDGTHAEFYNWYGTSSHFFGRFKAITNPTIGNHEYTGAVAPGYFNYWDNVPDYYSFSGAGWHFLTINSADNGLMAPGSAQSQWLTQDLAAQGTACTIAYWHHPRYSIGPEGDTPELQAYWAAMAQAGVDIALTGHDHHYQRWQPLDANGTLASQGITQFVVGSGGHGIRPFARTDARMSVGFDTPPASHGSLYLALNPQGAEYRYINLDGEIWDYGVIPCSGAAPDTTAPTAPANLTAPANPDNAAILTWESAWDNTGVVSYTIVRDGTPLDTVSGALLTYTDYSAQLGTTYAYHVAAVDPTANVSSLSNGVNIAIPGTVQITLNPVADSYTKADSPTSNYGSATTLRIDASPATNAYLRFDIPALGGPLVSATLRVYANSNSSIGHDVRAVSDNNWDENTLNANNAPSFGASVDASGAFAAGSWTTVDVTSLIQDNAPNSFALTTSSNTAISYASRQDSNAPELVLVLGSAPPTATPTPTPTFTATATVPAPTATATPLPTATATPTSSGPMTFTVMADTYVQSTNPGGDYSTSNRLYVDLSPDRRIYLLFDLQALGSPVTTATLRIYAESSSSAGFTVHSVADTSWATTGMTYNTAPPFGPSAGASGAVVTGLWSTVDVTPLVSGNGLLSIALTTPGNTNTRFSSLESMSANPAQLIVATAGITSSGLTTQVVPSVDAQPGTAAQATPAAPMELDYRFYLPLVITEQ